MAGKRRGKGLMTTFFCFCSEYLATFKKTVAMHEVFLQRLASHPTLRSDRNYQVFLEFDGDVSFMVVPIGAIAIIRVFKIMNECVIPWQHELSMLIKTEDHIKGVHDDTWV